MAWTYWQCARRPCELLSVPARATFLLSSRCVPIVSWATRCLPLVTTARVMSDSDFQRIEADVKEQVEHALEFAEQSPLPDLKELYTDVYANPIVPDSKRGPQ